MRFISWILIASILSLNMIEGQEAKSIDISVNSYVDGTLLEVPNTEHLAIIIGGSGPIDRDGNQGFSKSSYLKKLASGLAQKGISSFRYDKRVVKQLKTGTVDPETSFDDFVSDAREVIRYFKNLNSYTRITVIGHSQGALVAMLAADEGINSLVSLNGPAKNIGDVLIEQVSKSAPEFEEATRRVITSLKNGKTTTEYPPELASAFNIETQPFLISWIQYGPAEIISELTTQVLIVQGTKDMQIEVADAKALKTNCNNCQLELIENMNHVLFEIEGDELENYKSYSDPSFKTAPQLIEVISEFIKSDQ